MTLFEDGEPTVLLSTTEALDLMHDIQSTAGDHGVESTVAMLKYLLPADRAVMLPDGAFGFMLEGEDADDVTGRAKQRRSVEAALLTQRLPYSRVLRAGPNGELARTDLVVAGSDAALPTALEEYDRFWPSLHG